MASRWDTPERTGSGNVRARGSRPNFQIEASRSDGSEVHGRQGGGGSSYPLDDQSSLRTSLGRQRLRNTRGGSPPVQILGHSPLTDASVRQSPVPSSLLPPLLPMLLAPSSVLLLRPFDCCHTLSLFFLSLFLSLFFALPLSEVTRFVFCTRDLERRVVLALVHASNRLGRGADSGVVGPVARSLASALAAIGAASEARAQEVLYSRVAPREADRYRCVSKTPCFKVLNGGNNKM